MVVLQFTIPVNPGLDYVLTHTLPSHLCLRLPGVGRYGWTIIYTFFACLPTPYWTVA